MIEWFTLLQVFVACAAGLLCVILGLAGRRPSDLSVGSLALVWLLLIAQVVIAIVAAADGQPPDREHPGILGLSRLRRPPGPCGRGLGTAGAKPMVDGHHGCCRVLGSGHGVADADDLDHPGGLSGQPRTPIIDRSCHRPAPA